MVSIGLTTGWGVTFWTLGILVGLVALFALFQILVDRYGSGSEGWVVAAVFMGVLAFLVGVGALVTWFILPDANHNNYTITGKVTEVTNRLDAGSGDLTTLGYAFRIDTTEDVLWTTDARIQARVGESVDLLCTRHWVTRASDYWECRPNDALTAVAP